MSRISVVVPSYNDADMLGRCLAALVVQTRPADEIVVVDNGSSDDTAAVGASYGARVVHEPKRGIPQATSAGFDAARGEILCRLDADSVPPPDWIERVERAFADDDALDALSGPGRFYGANAAVHWAAEHLYIGTYSNAVSYLLGHDILFGSNLALRAVAWRRLRDRVHRDLRGVHDDLDLTINLVPGMGVRFDRSLVVGVSARPFDDWSGFSRRFRMAMDTFAINHREESLARRRRAWLHATRPEVDPVPYLGADR